MRVGYCMNIHYRKTGTGNDKVGTKLLSGEMKKNLQCNITGLQPCTEYSFTVTVFNSESSCDFSPPVFGLRTTGPFRITTIPSGNCICGRTEVGEKEGGREGGREGRKEVWKDENKKKTKKKSVD